MRKLFYAMSMLLTVALVWTGCTNPKPEPSPVEKFTVTFNSQGGSDVSSLTINKGAKITEPANPTKGDLIFVDWFKEATYVNVWNFSTDVVTADITLYAKWTTVEYTVTFNTTGGSAIEAVKVAKGATFQAPLPPSKENFAFSWWFKEEALTTEWDFNSDVVTADITIYAKWSEITREALWNLIHAADAFNSDHYTKESHAAMIAKANAVRVVAENDNATQAQIVAAYTELQAAINALVALPVKEPVGISVNQSIVDGFIYVSQGQVMISASAVDAEGDDATDSRVTFTFEEELTEWAEMGSIEIHDNSLRFMTKGGLTAGATRVITIKSAAKPAISTTVTLKIPAVGELKTKFLAIVNALPAPDKISYDDYVAIYKAWDLYSVLTFDEQQEEAVQAASIKLEECNNALWDLPARISYSFSGNVCTFDWKDFGEPITEKKVFASTGAFPLGTYTDQDWDDDGKGYTFTQFRMEFKSDGKGEESRRTAEDANGKNATVWGDIDAFTYTFTGTKATGGIFYITYIN